MTKMVGKIRNGFYCQQVVKNRNLIIVSLFLAILCVMITYPGILYTDSYSRVSRAYDIKKQFQNAFAGQQVTSSTWLTIIPSFFIAVCYELTGNIAFYTVCQAFAFFLGSFLVMKKLAGKYRVIEYCLFLICPIFYCVGVYYDVRRQITIGCNSKLYFRLTSIRPRGLTGNCTFLSD